MNSKSNICPYCGIAVLPGGEQVFPDRASGRWHAVKIGTCPKCESTKAYGEPREIDDEERKERGLPRLDELVARFGAREARVTEQV